VLSQPVNQRRDARRAEAVQRMGIWGSELGMKEPEWIEYSFGDVDYFLNS
jgi:hypothetical protein